MTNYSDGWQLPTADDVTADEMDRWSWIVENDVTAIEPHPDGVRSGKDGTVIDVRTVAANGVRKPLFGRTAADDGEWRIDDESGAFVALRAPSVRYSAESGRPQGWSEQAPESSPVRLALSDSRPTRSRKGRSSFVVKRRKRRIGIVGDREATGCDWAVPPGLSLSGAQLAAVASAYVRAYAFQTGAEVEPLPRLIGADDGRQMAKPMNVDRSDVSGTVAADVTVEHVRRRWVHVVERAADVVIDGVKLPGRVVWSGYRQLPIRPDDIERRPYLLATSDSALRAPGVTAQWQQLAGIDDGAIWRTGHESGVSDAWPMFQRLPRRMPARIVKRTAVLADTTDENGRRRVVRGTVRPDGVQELVAPGVGGWWVGHTFHASNGRVRSKAAKQARTVQLAEVRATVDGWLPLAVALRIGEVAVVEHGTELARPSAQRFEVRMAGKVHGGRTAAAAITKAKRDLQRVN